MLFPGGEPLVHATTAHVTGATHGSLPAAHNAGAENWSDKDVTSWLEKNALGKYKKRYKRETAPSKHETLA